MQYVIYIIRYTLGVALSVEEFAMFLRAILSWIDMDGNWKITQFLIAITEPIITPIRLLCQKNNWFQNIPLDVPFLLTWIIISLLESLVFAI